MIQDFNAMTQARLKELMSLVANKRGVFVQRTKLRMELPIQAGIGQYIFDLKKESLGNGLTTFALKRDDIVVPNAIGFLIAISHKVNGTEVEELYSFAPKNDGTNPSVFPVGFQTDAIENLYNGFLNWTVGSTVAWENYPMEAFKKVFRQQGAYVLNSSDVAVHEGIQPEHDIEKMLQPVLAKYYIAGTQDHQMTVNFPAAGLTFPLCDKNGVTTDYTAKLVLYMDAFKIKNGTKIVNVNIDESNPLAQASWAIANA